MRNELTINEEKAPVPAPEYGGGLAVSLARAEVDQQVQTARSFPRSITRAIEHILTLATIDEKTAGGCIYALPRGRDEEGKKKIIKGPSIRLAEIAASQWGNCRIGARVVHVDRFEKYVEAEGVFHDLETNTAWTSRVRRGIAEKKGRVYSEDMIVVTGNAACAIAKRNAIFAGIPRGVWGKAYDAAEHVIAGDMRTLVARRRSALATLAGEYGITAERIFEALEIGGEEDIDRERLSVLTAMRTSLKNGEATVEELFPKSPGKETAPKDLAGRLDAVAAASNDPPHDPETGEIIGDAGEDAARAEENQSRNDSEKTKPESVQTKPEPLPPEPADLGTQRLLADARAKTKEGAIKFKYWVARLNQKNIEQIAPYLERLRAEANAVDAAKVTMTP